MSARKPVDENCTGSIDCPVRGHTKTRITGKRWRLSHVPLTLGQQETLWERLEASLDSDNDGQS